MTRRARSLFNVLLYGGFAAWGFTYAMAQTASAVATDPMVALTVAQSRYGFYTVVATSITTVLVGILGIVTLRMNGKQKKTEEVLEDVHKAVNTTAAKLAAEALARETEMKRLQDLILGLSQDKAKLEERGRAQDIEDAVRAAAPAAVMPSAELMTAAATAAAALAAPPAAAAAAPPAAAESAPPAAVVAAPPAADAAAGPAVEKALAAREARLAKEKLPPAPKEGRQP